MSVMRAMGWWCGAVILFGAVLAGGALAATDGVTVLLLERFGGAAVTMTPALRFAVGLMGAVTIGWGASLLALAATPLPGEVRQVVWRRVGWGVLAWFAIDSAISVATGFWPNVVSNAVLAGVFWGIVAKLPSSSEEGKGAP